MRQPRNFTKFWFYRYGLSNTANDLAEAVGGKLIALEGSVYRKRPGQVLINWGNSRAFREAPDLNAPTAVAVATSKTRTFDVLQRAGINVPDFTRDRGIAQGWLKTGKVLGRDIDNGSQGRGITVYQKGEILRDHKFYVRYFRKNRELRIHVFKGKVIFEQEKLKKNGEEHDKYIRSHDRGWCFAFNHLAQDPCPEIVRNLAVSSVGALDLDFGAIDCGWNAESGGAVFEVNTAPGLEESSLKAYAEVICGL